MVMSMSLQRVMQTYAAMMALRRGAASIEVRGGEVDSGPVMLRYGATTCSSCISVVALGLVWG